jgi:uncharacterized protein YjdB
MKKYLAICLLLCISVFVNAQATDLVVDCQTPGWLSSKINYGDQLTVKNLKVTGYINSDDLKFIGSLISNYSLQDKVDLSDVNIVSNSMEENSFGINEFSNINLKCLSLPKTAEKLSSILPYTNKKLALHVDTLYFNCNVNYIKGSMLSGNQCEMPHHIIVGDKVDSIPNNAFDDAKDLLYLKLPTSIKYIGDRAFYGCKIQKVNFNELEKIKYLGHGAFAYLSGTNHACDYQPDSLIIPQSLDNTFNFSAFSYRDGQHIFVEDNIKAFSGALGLSYQAGKSVSEKINLHINNTIPPSIKNYQQSAMPFKNSTIYVPKGAKAAYEKSDWKNATIIELNPVESVTLNKHSVTLNKNEQFSLSATILPEDADDKSISWTSEDPSIAQVDENGTVTALKEGQTEIVVTSVATGIQDRCTIIVRKNVTGVSLNEEQIIFSNLADTKQLTATLAPEDATEKAVTWTSSNEQVCTVSATGLVTATGIGSTIVTVKTVDGGLTANCVVKVLQHVDGLTLNKTNLSLNVGKSEKLEATITPNNADNKKVIWSSSDDNVATVDVEGNVTAVKAGQVTITATSDDNSDVKTTCAITVIQPVTGITLSESTYKLTAIGKNLQLTATILPEDATNKNINWSCPNNTVCVVSNGNVVAVGYGTAVIIALTEDGGFMATCTVTVENTTGIMDVKSDNSETLPAYDTMGRKVLTLKKGQLYIRQGKKFLVK